MADKNIFNDLESDEEAFGISSPSQDLATSEDLESDEEAFGTVSAPPISVPAPTITPPGYPELSPQSSIGQIAKEIQALPPAETFQQAATQLAKAKPLTVGLSGEVAPIAGQVAVMTAMGNPLSLATLAAGAAAFAGISALKDYAFGDTPTEVAAKVPGNVLFSSLPLGSLKAGTKVAKAVGAGLGKETALKALSTVLGSVASLIGARRAESVISGRPEKPITGGELALTSALSAFPELAIGGGKALMKTVIPEKLAEIALRTGNSIPQAFFAETGTTRQGLMEVLASTPIIGGMIKAKLGQAGKALIQDFAESFGSFPKNFDFSNIPAVVKELEKQGAVLTGEARSAVRKMVNEALPKNPGFVDVTIDAVKDLTAASKAAQADKVFQSALKNVLGKTDDEIRTISALSLADQTPGISQSVKEARLLASPLEQSRKAGLMVKEAIDNAYKDAKTNYGLFEKNLANSGASSLGLRAKKTWTALEDSMKMTETTMDSLKANSKNKSLNKILDNFIAKTDELNLGDTTAAIREINDELRGSMDQKRRSVLTSIKKGLQGDLGDTLTFQKLTSLMDEYTNVNRQYAEYFANKQALGRQANANPDWVTTDDWWAYKQLHSKEEGEPFRKALKKLGIEDSVLGTQREADIRSAMEESHRAGQFDQRVYANRIRSSKALSTAEKDMLVWDSLPAPVDARGTLPSGVKSTLREAMRDGSDAAWRFARDNVEMTGIPIERAYRSFFKKEFLNKAMTSGGAGQPKVFSTKLFQDAIAENPELLARIVGGEDLAKAILSNTSLLNAQASMRTITELAKDLSKVGNVSALNKLFLNEAKLSPGKINYLFGVLGEEPSKELRGQFVNNLLTSGLDREMNFGEVLKKIPQVFNPTLPGGYSPATLRAIMGDKPFAAFKQTAEAIKALDRLAPKAGAISLETLLPSLSAITNKIGQNIVLMGLGEALISEPNAKLMSVLANTLRATSAKAQASLSRNK